MMEEFRILSNGVRIPKIMLGTYSINGDDAIRICNSSYNAGFRGFDCARFYGNEKDWGRAFKELSINRSNIFIQTKVNYKLESEQEFDVIKDFDNTLENFQVDYIDAYLIHWPIFDKFEKTWRGLEELYRSKKVRAIGVCNFRVEHFRILEKSATIMPMIAQFERHPCRKQPELVQYCKDRNIQIEAYSPLAVSKPGLVGNGILNEIALQHNCSVQQIALAWNIQSGVIPLPRTKTESRVKDNYDSLRIELTSDEMDAINNNEHYFRALTENLEFPGYWDQIHKIDIEKYVGECL